MSHILEAILQRRAIKLFDPVEIPADTREQILHAARVAPSSFNIQPYRFYWVETAGNKDRSGAAVLRSESRGDGFGIDRCCGGHRILEIHQ